MIIESCIFYSSLIFSLFSFSNFPLPISYFLFSLSYFLFSFPVRGALRYLLFPWPQWCFVFVWDLIIGIFDLFVIWDL
jgi:hypothetical protein